MWSFQDSNFFYEAPGETPAWQPSLVGIMVPTSDNVDEDEFIHRNSVRCNGSAIGGETH
jgi:hypothetical protein